MYMLFSILNLLMRWLFFVAIIWPVRAEAIAFVGGSMVKASVDLTIDTKVYWTQPDFAIFVPEIKEGMICNTSIVSLYFKAEEELMEFSLNSLNKNIAVLSVFYEQAEEFLKGQRNNKKVVQFDSFGLENLNQYSEIIYTASDELNTFFNNLFVCWELRPSQFSSLQRLVNNYRNQDVLIAELTQYFFNSLQQIAQDLKGGDLSIDSKRQVLNQVKFLLKLLQSAQKMIAYNYKELSSSLKYNHQVYWGI